MARYIDADNIKFDISGLVYIEPNDYKEIAFYFLKQLDEMPSADVAEVVRCKDCAYYEEEPFFGMSCVRTNSTRSENDYCSRGRTVEDVENARRTKATWKCLGHQIGFLKHPDSIDFRCTNCGYEAYTLYTEPPKHCPQCEATMEKETDA